MAITAIHPDQTWEFIPESDRESGDPTTFILAPLSAIELGQCNIKASGEGFGLDLNSANEIVRRALKGARNFLDMEGNEVNLRIMKGRPLDIPTVRKIPPGVVLELAGEVMRVTYATGDDLKN